MKSHPLVIISLSDPADFWNDELGWTTLAAAYRYNAAARETRRLPMGGAWTTYEAARKETK